MHDYISYLLDAQYAIQSGATHLEWTRQNCGKVFFQPVDDCKDPEKIPSVIDQTKCRPIKERIESEISLLAECRHGINSPSVCTAQATAPRW